MQLTDGSGQVTVHLSIEYLPPHILEPEVVLPIRFSLSFQDPNEVREHVAVLGDGIDLKNPGRYRVTLAANGITISQRYFAALRAS